MNNKYYNYVTKIQIVIISIFTLYMILFSSIRIHDYYHNEPIWYIISAILFAAVILLVICWKLMDNIKENSWVLYNIVLSVISAIYAIFIYNAITLKLIKEIDYFKILTILKELLKTLSIANPDLYYIRMVFCITFTAIMIIYIIISVIMNTIKMGRDKDFFAN